MLKDSQSTSEGSAVISSTPLLRTATYVTIHDLVATHYNVDLDKLIEEIKVMRTNSGTKSSSLNLEEESRVNDPLRKSARSPENDPFTSTSSKTAVNNRLQPPKEGFNICALIGKVDIVVDKFRVDGTRVLVAEVLVGDASGCVLLRARDEQIELLWLASLNGDHNSCNGAVVLRNCTVEFHRGKYLRLAVGKWGKMSVYPDGVESTPEPPITLNEDRNFSLVDLNLIATPKDRESKCSIRQLNIKNPINAQQMHQLQHHPIEVDEDPSSFSGSTWNYPKGRKKYPRPWKQSLPCSDELHHHEKFQAPPNFAPPFQYSVYTGGEASCGYTYSSPSTVPLSPLHSKGIFPLHQLSSDSYKQQQEQLLYQQYECQQRHAHQMHILQEAQRHVMATDQQLCFSHQSLHPQQGIPIPNVSSFESQETFSEDYSCLSAFGMTAPMLPHQPGTPFSPTPSSHCLHSSPMPYPYSPPSMSTTVGTFSLEDHEQQHRPPLKIPLYDSRFLPQQIVSGTLISPPLSPLNVSHPRPPPASHYFTDSPRYMDHRRIDTPTNERSQK